MKLLSLFSTLLLFIGLGISPSAEAQQTINGSITHDGLTRDYILYVPANYTGNEAVPLVFNFHGYTSTATQQMWYGDFRAVADTAGFLIVHPMGTLDNTNTTHFNVGWGASSVDDVGFSGALLDSLSAAYNINADRVYSTGMSNGGFMSYYLACAMSDRIAAIASVTGSMSPFQMNGCSPVHPTPIMEIHGTNDPTVPYNGAAFAHSIPDVLQYWITYNNAGATPVTLALPDLVQTDGSTVEHIIYGGGTNGVTVEHMKVNGGAHTWPGTVFNSAGTNYDINASAEVWKFFMRFDINGAIDPSTGVASAEREDDFQAYPNPTTGQVNLIGSNLQAEYRLLSPLGAIVMTGSTDEGVLDLSALPDGLYYLQVGTQTTRIVKTH